MSLVSLNNAHFDYGREKILRGVDVALHTGVMCALVGPNGAGKTTLLSALSGELQLQGGTRQVSGSTRIAVLRQESSLDLDGGDTSPLLETVADAAFGRERELEGELALIASRLENETGVELEDLVRRQGVLQAEFERLDGYSARARLASRKTSPLISTGSTGAAISNVHRSSTSLTNPSANLRSRD